MTTVASTSSPAMTALKFSIVVPTYNEAGGIERLIVSLNDVFTAHQLDGEIVVVDDNSPDGTGAIVDGLAAKYPVRCLHRAGKMGLSSGVIDGWKFARPDSVALGAMDADFSHDVERIARRWSRRSPSGEYGLAIGSRYVPGGGIENWPLHRKITSLVAIALAKPLTPVRDITSRIFSREPPRTRRRRTRSDRFQDRSRSDRESALRTRARSAVRLHRSRRRYVEAQPSRDLQLLATARPHLSRPFVRTTVIPEWLRIRRGPQQALEDAAQWTKCPKCATMLYRPDLAKNLFVCTTCKYHFRMHAFDRISMLVDADFIEIGDDVLPGDPLGWTDKTSYPAETRARSREIETHRRRRLRLRIDRRDSGRARRDGLQLSRRHDGHRRRRASRAFVRRCARAQTSARRVHRFRRRAHGRRHAGA